MISEMNKTKILLLIILFLLVTNIVTIITGIISGSAESEAEAARDTDAGMRINFFAGQLGLSEVQKNDFIRFNRSFNREARMITSGIESLRFRMVDEMASPEPDMQVLDSICAGIGKQHTLLKKETVDYYLNLKTICDEEQQEKLHGLFREMSDPDGDLNRFGRGRGMGQGMQGRTGGRRGPYRMRETETINQ